MLEQNLEKQERRMRELEAENAALDREVATLLEELRNLRSIKELQGKTHEQDIKGIRIKRKIYRITA